MAQHLKLLLAILLSIGWAQAEDLPDPTRPGTGSEIELPSKQKQATEYRLQSVLISRERKSAIINGQTIALGGRLGSARLVAVRQGEVVLQTEGGTQTLKLFPGVEKRGE